jgi:Ran GTPase-activating protein (RanGAP) involved in mRNA processing and transport
MEDVWDSDDTWESDVESEAEIAEIMQLDIAEDASNTGKREYLAKCSELKIVPVAMFIAKLDCEHINLRHHGMGVKGALAISAAVVVNSQIRSLNLGDNWLKDDGTHALAQVLSTNSALTSINLSDNRIGLPGIISLCQHLQDNSTLAELSLKGNALADRSARELAAAFKQSSSLTKVDLSYNEFSEEAGKAFGDMLASHSHLLDVNLKWNALKANGGKAIAKGLESNQVLNKMDLGWNGLGDEGMRAVAEMLKQNAALTHLDVSHNRVNPDGCRELAEGIKNNHNLLSLEVGFNPMGVTTSGGGRLQHDTSGIVALIDALRTSENVEQVGLSNVQSGGSYARGRASRFDPKNPDGHYALDLLQPWDRFIAETLHERMINEKGESWINVGLDAHAIDIGLDGWKLPEKGTLDFDYVTWKRGLEASFRLDLSNPCALPRLGLLAPHRPDCCCRPPAHFAVVTFSSASASSPGCRPLIHQATPEAQRNCANANSTMSRSTPLPLCQARALCRPSSSRRCSKTRSILTSPLIFPSPTTGRFAFGCGSAPSPLQVTIGRAPLLTVNPLT